MLTQNLLMVQLQSESATEQQPPQSQLLTLFKKIQSEIQKLPTFETHLCLSEKSNLAAQTIGNGKLITKKMRTKLLNWMEKLVLETFEFSAKTLLLAIKILDQYLSLTNQTPGSLQIIGCASLYLASKTSESTIVGGQSYVIASANCFTQKELIKKEMEIFETLKFNTKFNCFIRVYNIMKSKFQSKKLKNYKISEIQKFLISVAKNLDFIEFREHQIVGMMIAIIQIDRSIPDLSTFQSLLKQHLS